MPGNKGPCKQSSHNPPAGIAYPLVIAEQRSFSLLRESSIFPILAKILTGHPRCAARAAQVLAEMAKDGTSYWSATAQHTVLHQLGVPSQSCFLAIGYWPCKSQLLYFHTAKAHKSLSFSPTEEMKTPCIEADLVPALVPLLESTDQELLLHAGRAIGRICYGNRKYRLVRSLFSLAVRHHFVRHLNFMRPEHSMHFSLHLHRRFQKLTGTRLNASQRPPDLWILDCKVTHLCQTAHAIALIYFYRGWIPQDKAGPGGLAKLCPEPIFPTHVRWPEPRAQKLFNF